VLVTIIIASSAKLLLDSDCLVSREKANYRLIRRAFAATIGNTIGDRETSLHFLLNPPIDQRWPFLILLRARLPAKPASHVDSANRRIPAPHLRSRPRSNFYRYPLFAPFVPLGGREGAGMAIRFADKIRPVSSLVDAINGAMILQVP